MSSTAQVVVGVDDVNNNKPVFEKVRRVASFSLAYYLLVFDTVLHLLP